VRVYTPILTYDSGFSLRGARPAPLKAIMDVVDSVGPDVVHITGPHLWNLPALRALTRRSIPTVHTLHDLQPHKGSPYGVLLYEWNRQVLRRADHVVVHSRLAESAAKAVAPNARVTCMPLLHGFWGRALNAVAACLADRATTPPAPLALFFGRLERYKGIDVLLRAWALARQRITADARLVLAGSGDLARFWSASLPLGVEPRTRHIADEEALDLFRCCSVLVLPYTGATQSALTAAAAYFHKPVIVSSSGALSESVVPGKTGWIVPAGDHDALADALATALADVSRLESMGNAARDWYNRARKDEWTSWRTLYGRVREKK